MKKYALYSIQLLWLSMALVFCSAVQAGKSVDIQHITQPIIHSLDYVAVDYPGAFENGKIAKQSEYEEQLEIATNTLSLMQGLPENPQKSALIQKATAIRSAILNKAPPDQVVPQCHDTVSALIDAYHVTITPAATPSLADGKQLFQSNCVACHGAEGYGNGAQAAVLDPKPANFHDRNRQENRSVLDLYNAISLGVNGTAMPSFSNLTSMQRWSLAFYVSTFFANDTEKARGETLWTGHTLPDAFKNMQQLVQLSPSQAASQWGDGSPRGQRLGQRTPGILQRGPIPQRRHIDLHWGIAAN